MRGGVTDGGGAHLLYLAPGDPRKGRVEPIEWMRTCAAFTSVGVQTRLVALSLAVPDRVAFGAVWEHFGLEPTFRIRLVPTPFGDRPSGLAFRLRVIDVRVRRLNCSEKPPCPPRDQVGISSSNSVK